MERFGYSPDQLELYLIDFKSVEFKVGWRWTLFEVVADIAVESEREFD